MKVKVFGYGSGWKDKMSVIIISPGNHDKLILENSNY